MKEATIPPNWTYIFQHRLQINAPNSIDLNDTWFTPYIEEYPRKNPIHEPIVTPENNRNTLTFSQSVLYVQAIPDREGVYVSEVIKLSTSEVF